MKLPYALLGAASTLLLVACSQPVSETTSKAPAAENDGAAREAATAGVTGNLEGVAAAAYSLEPTHAFLTATVIHNGLSEYTLDFTKINGTLQFDPADPAASSLTFTIDPASVYVNFPGDYKASHADSPYETWPEALSRDEKFMNADAHKQIRFVSTGATRTADDTGTVTGDLSFRGVTRPVTLNVTYNGFANAPWYGERDMLGFDATGTIRRSDFGQTVLADMISDEVTIGFSGEFLQDENPASAAPATPDGN